MGANLVRPAYTSPYACPAEARADDCERRRARRRRRCGDLEHPAVGRLQRRRAGGARSGIARASRPVRDGQALARIGSPAAAAVLNLRNPARAATGPRWACRCSTSASAPAPAPLRDRAWRARGMSRTARPALRAGRSAGGSLDGRRRRRPRAVRHAGRGAPRARHDGPAVLRRAPRLRAALRRAVRTSRRRAGAGHRRREPRHAGLRDRARSTRRWLPCPARGTCGCMPAGRRR